MLRYFIVAAALACCLVARGSAATSKQDADRARDILRGGVESKDADVRIQAVIAASLIGRNELVIKRLETLLQDKDVQVRIAVIHALSDFKSTSSVPALENTLQHDDVPEVSFAAAKALYTMQDSAGKQALLDVYNGKVNADSNLFKKKGRNVLRNFHSVQSATMFVVGEGIGYVPVPGVGEGFSP